MAETRMCLVAMTDVTKIHLLQLQKMAFLKYDKSTSKDTYPSKSMFINNMVQLLDDGDFDKPCYKVLDLYLDLDLYL